MAIAAFVGVYSSLKRGPRFRAVALAYARTIMRGAERGAGEGCPCWYTPQELFGRMAFDCEQMLKDYISGKQRLS